MTGPLVDDIKSSRTIPSLVQSCQRVLGANIDSITSFGDGIPHRLIGPILQGCNPDTLLRLERVTPRLQERTSELWKDICIRTYPIAVEQILKSSREDPKSWRDVFFCIRKREAKRFEEAASRIRNQRIEAEELKRKRQVKLTDRLPEPKRSRSGWSTGPAPPKTLFEKTRKEATKIQRSVFGPRILPPSTGNSKGFRAKVDVCSSKNTPKDSNSVVINTITVRAPTSSNLLSPPFQPSRKAELLSKPFEGRLSGRPKPSSLVSVQAPITREASSGTMPKKDPMPAIFLPTRRTSSQLKSSSRTFSSR